MIELVCRANGLHRASFPDDEQFHNKPILEWFQQDRDSLCGFCFQRRQTERTRVATEAAIAQVDVHADVRWKAAALEAVRLCATTHVEFTADEVWAELEVLSATTHEPAALGPVFLRAARAGWIANTGRRRKRSLYARRHRELTIWGSRLRV